MTWKAEALKDAYDYHREPTAYSKGLANNFEIEGRGLTYEDYWIYVCLVGHQKYRNYNTAHWRDVDITTKTDVWNALQETNNER